MSLKLTNIVATVAEKMKLFRHKLHGAPEPAFEEFNTAALIAGYLQDIEGVEIRKGVGKTGVVGVLAGEKAGPCIALRADMDCLRMQEENNFGHASKNSGLMHGCGHDGHIACLVGAAIVLGKLRDQLPGPVKFIFQPAEENLGGAARMIADGVLQDPVPKAIFALHGTPSLPLGQVGLRQGPMMAASRYFSIHVTGKGTHAAMPHKGVDCVLAASQIVCAVHSIISRNIDPLEAALISIPRFEAAKAPNVLPSEVLLEGTLRALSNDTRDFLEKRLVEVVKKTADVHGARAEVSFYGGYPLLANDRKCCSYVADVANGVVGSENVCCDYPPSLGAEDFAFYLEELPGAFWWLGLGNKDGSSAPLHNPCFDFNDDAIPLAIELHCRLVLQSAVLDGREQAVGD
jgi:amidohydrolase